MHLFIIHYHLNRGGVTRVIENHLRGLATLTKSLQPRQVTIIHGGRKQDWSPDLASSLPFACAEIAIEQLDYDEVGGSDDLKQALDEYFKPYADQKHDSLIHIHNHQLGKNLEMPTAMVGLAQDGWRILLQIHDFSEELRPANYARMLAHSGSPSALRESLYPVAQHIHYATLNRGHQQILLDAGLSEDRVHLLPNPVADSAGPTSSNVAETRERVRSELGVPNHHGFVLYPVRGIRRKNLSELLLWSALVRDTTFGLTLAPMNPIERTSYDHWEKLSRELGLSVAFDVGRDISLAENYAACDAIVTTSIAEGFGMVFLESYLSGRELFGRDLPPVTADFLANGISFPHLVSSIQVPSRSIDHASLIQTYVDLIGESTMQYGSNFNRKSSATLRDKVESQFVGEYVDFAKLDAENQTALLRKISYDQELKTQLRELNDCFEQLETKLRAMQSDPSAMQPNQSTVTLIKQHYSLPTIGQAYSAICQELLQRTTSPIEFSADIGGSVLEHFLDPAICFATRIST